MIVKQHTYFIEQSALSNTVKETFPHKTSLLPHLYITHKINLTLPSLTPFLTFTIIIVFMSFFSCKLLFMYYCIVFLYLSCINSTCISLLSLFMCIITIFTTCMTIDLFNCINCYLSCIYHPNTFPPLQRPHNTLSTQHYTPAKNILFIVNQHIEQVLLPSIANNYYLAYNYYTETITQTPSLT